MSQYLTGHGNFCAKLRQFSLRGSANCKCGKIDTTKHTFQECEYFIEERKEYMRKLNTISIGWPPTWKQTIQNEDAYNETATYITKVLHKKEEWDKQENEPE